MREQVITGNRVPLQNVAGVVVLQASIKCHDLKCAGGLVTYTVRGRAGDNAAPQWEA